MKRIVNAVILAVVVLLLVTAVGWAQARENVTAERARQSVAIMQQAARLAPMPYDAHARIDVAAQTLTAYIAQHETPAPLAEPVQGAANPPTHTMPWAAHPHETYAPALPEGEPEL